MYVNVPDGGIDERGFNLLKQFRTKQPVKSPRSKSELKELLKEQSRLVRLDEKRAIEAIPKLVAQDKGNRRSTLEVVRKVVETGGVPKPAEADRLHRIEQLFNGANGHFKTGAPRA